MLNLLPREKSNFSTAQDQAHVTVGDQLEEVVRRADMPLGNRDDEPKIRPDHLVLDVQGLFLKLLDPIEVRGLGPGGVNVLTEFLGLKLEVIHLPEQVGFLVAVQERHLVEARQVGGQTLGCPGTARGLAVGRWRHRGHDLGLSQLVVETDMRDELELGVQNATGPDFVDQAINARPGTPKLSGKHLYRNSHPVAAINLALGFLVQGSRGGGEDRPVRMLPVVGLQGQANCFRGTCHLTCNPPSDLDQPDLAWAVKSHPTGSADDLVAAPRRSVAGIVNRAQPGGDGS